MRGVHKFTKRFELFLYTSLNMFMFFVCKNKTLNSNRIHCHSGNQFLSVLHLFGFCHCSHTHQKEKHLLMPHVFWLSDSWCRKENLLCIALERKIFLYMYLIWLKRDKEGAEKLNAPQNSMVQRILPISINKHKSTLIFSLNTNEKKIETTNKVDRNKDNFTISRLLKKSLVRRK